MQAEADWLISQLGSRGRTTSGTGTASDNRLHFVTPPRTQNTWVASGQYVTVQFHFVWASVSLTASIVFSETAGFRERQNSLVFFLFSHLIGFS